MITASRLYNPYHSKKIAQILKKRKSREFKIVVLAALAHLPLFLFLYQSSALALIHPVAAFLIGMYLAARKKVRLEWVVLPVAYIIGTEVIWRMAEVPIFWEFGKYSCAAIMLAALLARGCLKIPSFPLLYLLLLLPACFLTLMSYGFEYAKSILSSNMSGPFLLMVSCWFFSYVKVNREHLRRLLTIAIIPLIGIAGVTLFYTVAIENIEFNTESNAATSGGFGPNQVSSVLGLGAFLAVACLTLFNNNRKYKIFFGAALLLLSAQSLMTFSRGGMYNAIGAAVVLVFFQINNILDAIKRVFPVLVLAGLFLFFIFPLLNDFTGGKLEERFNDTGTTNRFEIIQSDLMILSEYPVLGLGIGETKFYREKFTGFFSSSHTEFTRLISEHGSFGVLALLCLIAMFVLNIAKHRFGVGRALVAGCLVWSSLFMMNAGMRLAAPSFIWGMSFITIVRMQRRKPLKRNGFKKRAGLPDDISDSLQRQ
jgi:hypothetical protein